MNGMQIGLIVALLIFLLVGSGMYFLVQRSGKRFIVAGKSLPFFIVGTMLFAQATEANGTLGGAGSAYTGGFWAGFILSGGVGVSLLLTGLFYAKPMNRMNLITLPDFFFRRYNNTVEILVSIISAIGFIILVAGNLAGAGWILSWVFPITLVQGMLIITAVVFIYTLCGGIFSCAATDVIQLYPAAAAFVGSVIWLLTKYGWGTFAANIPADFINLAGITSVEHGSLLFWGSFFAVGLGDIIALDFMERIFASESPETAAKGCYWGAGFTFLIAICASVLGLMAMTLFPAVEEPRNILPMMATDVLPFILGLFLMIGVIGAGLSTANGGLLAVCAVFARNILQRNILKTKRQSMNDEERLKFDAWLLKATRLMGIPVMGAAVILAYLKPEPGVMLVLAFDVLFAGCFFPLTLGLFWKKANTPGALAGIIGGSALRIILQFTIPPHLAGLESIIPGIFSGVLMVVVSLMTQATSAPKHHVVYETPSDELVLSAER